ncbi:hypothetical protein OOK36_48245 [Streptomyces sp. NBC_00365]|uniref:hypothetical protein n=1 Tax=Streptomyces sp. NBC_00365 TaxID=2975726 RepID=UPI0022557FAA|nr:hypothetical protein [Streptomyces sp. NBC_00365]MCX5096408.1 hypothetical protein [Streptomyces sp. NBC_00365]
MQKTCPHANACLTCPMFITTPDFLPQHREQRQQLLQIVFAAEARGQARVVEMNRQVLGNLEQIITTLEADPDEPEVTSTSAALRGSTIFRQPRIPRDWLTEECPEPLGPIGLFRKALQPPQM